MTYVQLCQPIYHDDAAEDTEGACTARIRLDCAGCGHTFDFCHLGTAALRACLARTWRCLACRPGVS